MALSGIEEFILFGFLPLMVGVFAGPRSFWMAEHTVAGKVSIPHTLPASAGAVAMVEIVELRRDEAALPVLASEAIAWRGYESQKFTLRFDPSAARPNAFYGLKARIVMDGVTCFETSHPHLVDLLSGEPVMLALRPVANKARPPAT